MYCTILTTIEFPTNNNKGKLIYVWKWKSYPISIKIGSDKLEWKTFILFHVSILNFGQSVNWTDAASGLVCLFVFIVMFTPYRQIGTTYPSKDPFTIPCLRLRRQYYTLLLLLLAKAVLICLIWGAQSVTVSGVSMISLNPIISTYIFWLFFCIYA